MLVLISNVLNTDIVPAVSLHDNTSTSASIIIVEIVPTPTAKRGRTRSIFCGCYDVLTARDGSRCISIRRLRFPVENVQLEIWTVSGASILPAAGEWRVHGLELDSSGVILSWLGTENMRRKNATEDSQCRKLGRRPPGPTQR